MKTVSLVALFALLASPHAPIEAAAPNPSEQLDDPYRAFLTKYCRECHASAKPKGDFNLDNLSADFDNAANEERWLVAMKRVQAGEMPPKGKQPPAEKDIKALSTWVDARASAARLAHGRAVVRRLNRTEYQNTVRDLLGIDVDFQ